MLVIYKVDTISPNVKLLTLQFTLHSTHSLIHLMSCINNISVPLLYIGFMRIKIYIYIYKIVISYVGYMIMQDIYNVQGAIVVVIEWQLYLQLPMQSVPITTNIVSLNHAHGEVYSIKYYLVKFVSDLRQAGSILQVLQFPPPIKLTAMI